MQSPRPMPALRSLKFRSRGLALCVAVSIAGVTGCSKKPPAESTPAPLEAAATPVESKGPTVVFLGDSLTAGYELASEQAFPALLSKRLAASGHAIRAVNAGVSGDTTSGGLRRLDWLLTQKPQVVVIELGANDGMRGTELATVEGNLRAIVDGVRRAGAVPLLLGMQLPPNYGTEYTAAFAALYPKLAEELKVAFVPWFMGGVAGHSELNLADGIHPTARGHELLADHLDEPLRKLLTDASDHTR